MSRCCGCVLLATIVHWGCCTQVKKFDVCYKSFQGIKQRLRNIGYWIPSNGEHFPISGVEGGPNEKEFIYLENAADKLRNNAQICQTGFNYGISAWAFLCSSDARVLSFDLGEHLYVNTSSDLIEKTFPGRHQLILGDSRKTLIEATSAMSNKCDLIVVDGGHSFDVAFADIENFNKLAKPGATILIDDCDLGLKQRDVPHIEDLPLVNAAYKAAIHQGIVENIAGTAYFDMVNWGRSICVGRYKT